MSEPISENVEVDSQLIGETAFELIQAGIEKSAENPLIIDLPKFKTICWKNTDEYGKPYSDLWSYIFGEFDIDAKFDSIPSKIHKNGCYFGMFENQPSIPKIFIHEAWSTDFLLGVEVTNFETIPEGLIEKEFSPSTYGIFTAKGIPNLALESAWRFIHDDWFPESPYLFNSEAIFFIHYSEKSGPSDDGFLAHLCVPVIKK